MAKAEENERVYMLHLNAKDDIGMMVCRYMDFDSFLQVLNGQFYVSVKRDFSDKYDAGVKVPRRYLFPIVPASEPENVIPAEVERLDDLRDKVGQSGKCLTSCWTTAVDDILMWKAYTSNNCGVCIVSTINNVVASFKSLNGHTVYCSRMYYDGFSYNDTPADYMFTKAKGYASEQEVRFYFLDGDIDSPNNGSKGNCKSFEWFSVTPDVMIDRIILSPNMRGNSAKLLKQLLEKAYPFLENRINKSELFDNK